LPFELQIPNKKTIKAIENSRQGKGKHNVTIFRRYPFKVGQKIYIEDGARRGDWEVVGVSDRKLKLRCPISNREFEWNRFCYFMEEAGNTPWPHPDE
jgi:hypothetical protein